MSERKPSPEGVSAAAKRIGGEVIKTPILPFFWEGRRLWAKAECLQIGGSFKIRGATNRLMQLNAEERARGVVAFSSGNHAQGIALAARKLGIDAVIVMPSDAPAVKRLATAAAGARIVEFDRRTQSREEIGAGIAAETGATLVPSFDDVDVIEGQGSVGLELAEQMHALTGGGPDKILIPCGGGGLSSGIALAAPDAEIITVEPEGWDDMARSFDAGHIVPVPDDAPPTLCDALQTKRVSPFTYGALRQRGARGVAVTEDQVQVAMAFAARELRLVVEPGGAAALAALLAGMAGDLTDRTAVVLSGGNVDPLLYSRIIASQAAEMLR